MAEKGWTAQVAAAAGVAAGTGAAQLGLGYGLGVVVWPAVPTDDSVWLGSLGWATWIAASATVFGAVIAGRLGRAAGGPWRFALAASAAVGALLTVALIALPARAAVRTDTFSPQTIAGGYAVIGVLLGLVIAYWAVVSRPVAANLIATAAWLWSLAVAAVVATDLLAPPLGDIPVELAVRLPGHRRQPVRHHLLAERRADPARRPGGRDHRGSARGPPRRPGGGRRLLGRGRPAAGGGGVPRAGAAADRRAGSAAVRLPDRALCGAGRAGGVGADGGLGQRRAAAARLPAVRPHRWVSAVSGRSRTFSQVRGSWRGGRGRGHRRGSRWACGAVRRLRIRALGIHALRLSALQIQPLPDPRLRSRPLPDPRLRDRPLPDPRLRDRHAGSTAAESGTAVVPSPRPAPSGQSRSRRRAGSAAAEASAPAGRGDACEGSRQDTCAGSASTPCEPAPAEAPTQASAQAAAARDEVAGTAAETGRRRSFMDRFRRGGAGQRHAEPTDDPSAVATGRAKAPASSTSPAPAPPRPAQTRRPVRGPAQATATGAVSASGKAPAAHPRPHPAQTHGATGTPSAGARHPRPLQARVRRPAAHAKLRRRRRRHAQTHRRTARRHAEPGCGPGRRRRATRRIVRAGQVRQPARRSPRRRLLPRSRRSTTLDRVKSRQRLRGNPAPPRASPAQRMP